MTPHPTPPPDSLGELGPTLGRIATALEAVAAHFTERERTRISAADDPHAGQCESETMKGGRCLMDALPSQHLCKMHARLTARATEGLDRGEAPKAAPKRRKRAARR